MPDPNVDLMGFICWLICMIPLTLCGLMVAGIFCCLVLNAAVQSFKGKQY